MLNITAIGILTNTPCLTTNITTGKCSTLLRIASRRRYRDRNGDPISDYITVKVYDQLAQQCMRVCTKGCLLSVCGDFETITFPEEPEHQPGFLIKGKTVEVLRRDRCRKKERFGN